MLQVAKFSSESPVKLDDLLESVNLSVNAKLAQEKKESLYDTCDSLPSKLFGMNLQNLAPLLFPVFSAIAPTQNLLDSWKTAISVHLFRSGSRC